ncbi:hypothetical protein DOTSEDRAFT_56328 [Dothistroma septosporum NZE10]|uniref:BTB domain-containing protein n=1 Tax=Dothistroma septosporum (strain NZE10 / CBS 128990) TaxID=675120 RepID=N1PCK0_DOTSN|nr:hypothetical protein DOTSEDRAFT_56328 [Dothistroma septosporum NZE10]
MSMSFTTSADQYRPLQCLTTIAIIPISNSTTAAHVSSSENQDQFPSGTTETDTQTPRKRRCPNPPSEDSLPFLNATNHSTSPVITILLGRGKDIKTFYVRKGQLCKSSPEFKKSLRISDAALHYFDLSSAAFALYIDWLYTSSIRGNATTEQEGHAEWMMLAQAYVLGEELEDHAFQSTVEDTMRFKAQNDEPHGPIRASAASIISVLYQRLTNDVSAHKLMIDMVRHFDVE